MEIGCIFKWKDFPYQKDGIIKDRYFIFMGRTSIFSLTTDYYLFTLTAELNYYEKNSKRSNNLFILIKKGNYRLPEDSIIDIDVGLHTIQENKILNNNKIINLGQISEELIRKIYNFVIITKYISKKVRIDIYDSLNKSGIYGLKKP